MTTAWPRCCIPCRGTFGRANVGCLTRFLLGQPPQQQTISPNHARDDKVAANNDCTRDVVSGKYVKDDDTRIGWVSTESHLNMTVGNNNDATAWNLLTHNGQIPDTVVHAMVQWVFGGGDGTDKEINDNNPP